MVRVCALRPSEFVPKVSMRLSRAQNKITYMKKDIELMLDAFLGKLEEEINSIFESIYEGVTTDDDYSTKL